ncbi:MAG: helix-turn-helix transcriptional regulator [Thermonemataceae bacterium]
MAEEPQIRNLLKLIRLLYETPSKSAKTLARYLKVTPRTINRYINHLRAVGFEIDIDTDFSREKRYYLIRYGEYPEKVLSFTLDESKLLNELVKTLHIDHPLRTSIIKKLYQVSAQADVAKALGDIRLIQNIDQLTLAIQRKQQVILKGYYSIESDTQRDRHVEPLNIQYPNSHLLAYELTDKKQKTFSLARIEAVAILDAPQINQETFEQTDVFGMSSKTSTEVQLQLTPKAYWLLIKEYPLAKPYIQPEGENYIFTGNICDVKGVGRFVMSLLNDVKVLQSETLKGWITQQVQQWTKNNIKTDE